jgi:hypothetical protein
MKVSADVPALHHLAGAEKQRRNAERNNRTMLSSPHCDLEFTDTARGQDAELSSRSP